MCCRPDCVVLLCSGFRWPAEAMGSCWSCLYRDPLRDIHLTKFKVPHPHPCFWLLWDISLSYKHWEIIFLSIGGIIFSIVALIHIDRHESINSVTGSGRELSVNYYNFFYNSPRGVVFNNMNAATRGVHNLIYQNHQTTDKHSQSLQFLQRANIMYYTLKTLKTIASFIQSFIRSTERLR